jgi:hypothetical protein
MQTLAGRCPLFWRLEDSDIRLGGQRTFHLFHLPHALLIGCVEAPVELRGDWSVMEFAIYDAVGQPVIRTNLKFQKHGLVRSEFDHILVQPGDYTAFWKSPGTCIGQGSSYNPYVGILEVRAPHPRRTYAKPALRGLAEDRDAAIPLEVRQVSPHRHGSAPTIFPRCVPSGRE